jgi:hypothetical protein
MLAMNYVYRHYCEIYEGEVQQDRPFRLERVTAVLRCALVWCRW